MTSQEELTRYFEVCGYSPDDVVSIVTRAAADGPLFWTFVPVSEAPKQIAGRSKVNCWFSANPMRKPADKDSRGSTADVTAVRALWADLDIKGGGLPDKKSAQKVMKGLASVLGVDPCAIVWSGHGFQPRWRLDTSELYHPASGDELTPVSALAPVIERFGDLVKMLCGEHGGKADSVYDMPRIIRAPFTMNIKPDMEPVPTKVWVYPEAGTVTFERLLAVLDEYVPASRVAKRETVPTENRHVGMERGDAYVESALSYILAELRGIAGWAPGQTDDRGRGWEKIQADAALRMASLAKADWNSLTLESAKELFTDRCPTDDGWTVRDVIKKWKSQERRAEPADPPADSDDPLSGGGVSPHRPAAGESAADVWGEPAGATADIFGDPAGDAGRGAFDAAEGAAAGAEPDWDADPGLGGSLAAEGFGGGPAAPWRKFGLNDVGNADRLIHLFGGELRYVETVDRWFRYADGAWRESKLGGQQAAMELLREVYRLEGELYSDVEYRKGKTVTSDRVEFSKWWEEQQSTTRIKAAAEAAKFTGKLAASATDFDAHPMLLNATNGVVDLSTGELIEHHPELLLRRQIPVAYVPEADCPQFEKFLERAIPDQEMRSYLQRIIGYTLTGDTGDQAVFIHWGPPASGKSVFMRIVEAILGEFSRVVPPTTLLTKKAESHPTDIMGLEGRRMLQVSELPEGARLDEALVKRLSGEETITARGMGQDFRDFRIVGKVHLVTNFLPHITDDKATHRRLHLVKWDVSIPEGERDPRLASRIISEELEGVLAWAVRGALEWRKNRLPATRPIASELDRAEYISSEDEFGQFIDEELILGAKAFTPSKDIFRRYVQWCEGLRMKPMSSVAFGRKLSARGVEARREVVRGQQVRGFVCALQIGSWARQDPLS